MFLSVLRCVLVHIKRMEIFGQALSSRALSESVYLILSAVDANVTWLGLVVEDDTFGTIHMRYVHFSCFQKRRTGHTPLMLPLQLNRVHHSLQHITRCITVSLVL